MRKKLKVLVSSVIGNALEFYDFTLFGAFTLKFSSLFYSAELQKEHSALFAQFLLFAVGFFTRPLGALFFGSMGDRFGRKKALSLSIILMGVATLLIGCLPTYATIGIAAPIGLALMRAFQGFCMGGENNGSAIFFLEHLKNNKGLAGALILSGGGIGSLMAYSFSAIVSMDGMPDYAWRLPFILGFFISLLGLYIRKNLPETDDFLSEKNKGPALHKTSLSLIWHQHRIPFLCAIGIGGVNVALAYTTSTYLHVYMHKVVGIQLVNALMLTCLAIILFGGIFAPLMGWLADKFSTEKIMKMGCLSIALFAFPLFYIVGTGSQWGVCGGLALMAFLQASFNGPSNAHLNAMFPASIRYTAVAVGYAVGAAIFGSLAPYYYAWLIDTTGNIFSPGLYMTAMAFLGYMSLIYSGKFSRHKK